MTTEPPATPEATSSPRKKVAIYIVAQDAVQSLSGVLDSIPPEIRERVDEIFVCDAGSHDDTYLVGLGYKALSGFEKLNVVRSHGDGIGASYKDAIAYCADRGYDIVVLLHAAGKFAPEAIETLLAPLLRGEVEAVFGSRFMDRDLKSGGMPVHKALGIRLLGVLQNRILGLHLTEHHCGFRAYSVPALAELPYQLNTDELHFDTELMAQLALADFRIAEVPVPVYTGDETRSLRGVVYAFNVVRTMAELWMHSIGLRDCPKYAIVEKYVYKTAPEASHQKIIELLGKDRQSVLDVGCGAGYLAEALGVRGNHVVGVDAREVDGVRERTERFIQADLDNDAIDWDGDPFNCVILADILEHLKDPGRLLQGLRALLADDGALIVSVPNVAHWSVRAELLVGRFNYRPRGILDHTHLRFFTLATITAQLDQAGYDVEVSDATTVPLEAIFSGTGLRGLLRLLAGVQRFAARLRPTLFGYQFVLRCTKRPTA